MLSTKGFSKYGVDLVSAPKIFWGEGCSVALIEDLVTLFTREAILTVTDSVPMELREHKTCHVCCNRDDLGLCHQDHIPALPMLARGVSAMILLHTQHLKTQLGPYRVHLVPQGHP